LKAGGGTHSDRTMRICGTLLVQATNEIIEQGKPAAAALLCTSDVAFTDGRYVSSDGKRASVFEAGRHVAEHGLPGAPAVKSLAAVADFTGRIAAHPTGAVVCELEIDPETGHVELLDYTSIDDVGNAVNPLIVDGQIHGGLAQGIGQALS